MAADAVVRKRSSVSFVLGSAVAAAHVPDRPSHVVPAAAAAAAVPHLSASARF